MQEGLTAIVLCPDGVAPAVLNSGANLSGKPLSVQSWQSESAPLPLLDTVPTHQFTPLFQSRVGQSAWVWRPLQPRLPLQRPVEAREVAQDFLRREHRLCTVCPKSVVGRPELSSVGVTPESSCAMVVTIQSGWGGQPGMLIVDTP